MNDVAINDKSVCCELCKFGRHTIKCDKLYTIYMINMNNAHMCVMYEGNVTKKLKKICINICNLNNEPIQNGKNKVHFTVVYSENGFKINQNYLMKLKDFINNEIFKNNTNNHILQCKKKKEKDKSVYVVEAKTHDNSGIKPIVYPLASMRDYMYNLILDKIFDKIEVSCPHGYNNNPEKSHIYINIENVSSEKYISKKDNLGNDTFIINCKLQFTYF